MNDHTRFPDRRACLVRFRKQKDGYVATVLNIHCSDGKRRTFYATHYVFDDLTLAGCIHQEKKRDGKLVPIRGLAIKKGMDYTFVAA